VSLARKATPKIQRTHTLDGTSGSVSGAVGRNVCSYVRGRLLLKCDGTCAETRFRLSAQRTSPFKSAGTSVQSTSGSRDVCISGSNAGYTMFRGSEKGTGYPLHSPVSPSLPLPCLTVWHHVSTGLYLSPTVPPGVCWVYAIFTLSLVVTMCRVLSTDIVKITRAGDL